MSERSEEELEESGIDGEDMPEVQDLEQPAIFDGFLQWWVNIVNRERMYIPIGLNVGGSFIWGQLGPIEEYFDFHGQKISSGQAQSEEEEQQFREKFKRMFVPPSDEWIALPRFIHLKDVTIETNGKKFHTDW